MQLVKENPPWAIAILILLITFFVIIRKGQWQKYLAASLAINILFITVYSIILYFRPINTATPHSPSGTLIDSARTIPPRIDTIENCDFLLDISGSVSSEILNKRLQTIQNSLRLKTSKFYVFGSCILLMDSTLSVDSLRKWNCDNKYLMSQKTDIPFALLSYLNARKNKKSFRTLMVITDDDNDPIHNIHPDTLKNAIHHDSNLHIILIRLPSKKSNRYLSHLTQFVTIDSIEKVSDESLQLETVLSYRLLMQELLPITDISGNNVRMSFQHIDLAVHSGLLSIEGKSEYHFWPVILHIKQIKINDKKIDTDHYVYLMPQYNYKFNLSVDQIRNNMGLLKFSSDVPITLDYDVYFGNSNSYKIDMATGATMKTGPLKGLMFQSYIQHTVAQKHNEPGWKGMIIVVLILIVIRQIILFTYRPILPQKIIVENTYHNNTRKYEPKGKHTIAIYNDYKKEIAMISAVKELSFINIFKQPYDKVKVETANKIYILRKPTPVKLEGGYILFSKS